MRLRDGSGWFWILASLVLIGGYRGIVARYEEALERSSAASREFQARIAANDLTLAQVAVLRDQERIARNDLARTSRENRLPRSTAELLEQLQELGRIFNVRVVSVVPQEQSSPAGTPQGNLMPAPLTIEAQGEFPAMLRFIQELPRHKTLVGIDSTQLAVSRSTVQAGAQLDATIHATLYRLRLDDVSRN